MQKPITVAREDFIQSLDALAASSGLPAFVMIEVYQGLARELEPLAIRQYQMDKQIYEENLKNDDNECGDISGSSDRIGGSVGDLQADQAALAEEQKETEAETEAEE
jgi:hypothetical protein